MSEAPKRRRWWAHRFSSHVGSFQDAFMSVGWVSFHLTKGPREGWAYRIAARPGIEVVVYW